MPFKPQPNTDIKDMAYAGYDDDAIFIICDKLKAFYAGYKSEGQLKDVTTRVAALRQNMHLVEKYVPKLAGLFKRAADLQDEWLANAPRIVSHGRPHHDNTVYDENDNWNLINEIPVLAPAAYDLAFISSNPYTDERSWEENLQITAGPGHLESVMVLLGREMNVSVEEQATALLCHCFTTAAKRFWEMNENDKEGLGPIVNPGQVLPDYFLAMAERVAPIANFNWN